jgi:hypothetical protein
LHLLPRGGFFVLDHRNKELSGANRPFRQYGLDNLALFKASSIQGSDESGGLLQPAIDRVAAALPAFAAAVTVCPFARK